MFAEFYFISDADMIWFNYITIGDRFGLDLGIIWGIS